MTNKQLAKKIDEFLPFWEKEENCYKTTLEALNRNDIKELQDMYNYFFELYNSDEILAEIGKRIKAKKMEAKQKIISFLDTHNNKIDGLELADFLQDNNIDYMYFADTKELFDYYNEDFDWNTIFFNNVILTKDGSIIILL